MKTFVIVVAIAGALIGPHTVMSASSYGGHTKETVEAMGVFCDQAVKDSKASNEPMTGALLKLCTN